MRALVTGATAGLGAEFATQLADRGYDLVLVARDSERLAEAQQRLPVDVELLAADLATDAGCDTVAERLREGDIDVLLNNAGIGTYQPFGEAELALEERQLDLNVRAVLRLAHAAVPVMTARGSGRIVNVSSMSAFAPRAGNATYAASKAWVSMFSEALAMQLEGTGVTVTVICPGFVHTEFHQRAQADMSHVPERMWLDARDVVREGLDDAFGGKPVSVPSRLYKGLAVASRTIPRPVLRAFMRRQGY
ncbi:SDR family NAD(P)-dependent oxidoreductase [Jatrophihabitans fulvus]